jgi:hypothetical protein
MHVDKHLVLNVAAIVVAGIACLISIRSCLISKEALDTTRAQFLAEKRPYLVVSPAKFLKSDQYLEIEKMKDGRVKLHLQLKLENIGNVAATDIRSAELPVIGKQGQIPTKSEGTVHPLALGPGQYIYRNYDLRFSGNEAGYAKKTVDGLKKNPVEIWESVQYRSEIDNTVEYETRIGYRVSMEDTNLLFQETKRLSGSVVVQRP